MDRCADWYCVIYYKNTVSDWANSFSFLILYKPFIASLTIRRSIARAPNETL
jgi:hypothetical protein